jgi:hypothetical protein
VVAVGDDGAEDAVGPAPHELAGPRVQPIGAAGALLGEPGRDAPAARARGEVDDPVHDARRPVDRRGNSEPPDPVAGGCVERHEVAVVGADIDAAAPHGGGGVDVGACTLGPEHPPAGGTEGVERPVGVPDEDAAVRDRRGGVEELAPTEPRLRAGPPDEPPGARVDRIDAAAVGPEVHLPVRVGRRAVDLVVGGERPARLAGVDVDRVELVIPGPGVEGLADDERRGLEGAGAERPDQLPRPRRHRRDYSPLAAGIAIARQRLHPGVVDDPIRDRRRRRGAVVEAALPDLLAGAVVDGEEAPALLGEVEAPVRDRRRELEHVSRLERPAVPERRPEPEVGRGVRPLHLQAVRRPGQPEDDLARTLLLRRLQRRDELDRRRAALVVDRRFIVKPEPKGDPRNQRSEEGTQDQQPCPRHQVQASDGAPFVEGLATFDDRPGRALGAAGR